MTGAKPSLNLYTVGNRHITVLTCEASGTNDVEVSTRIPRELRGLEQSDNEAARQLILTNTAAAADHCRHQIAELEGWLGIAYQTGFAEGVRVLRLHLHALFETLQRHEQRLEAAEAGISDDDLARAIQDDLKATAESWARARRSFDRARARDVRRVHKPHRPRVFARHARPTCRQRAPRRAARLSAVASAGDGSPPPEPDPPGEIRRRGAPRAGGAS